MASPPAITVETASLSQRGGKQFSLLSLLLLAAVACIVAAYIGERRRREEAERQLREIRVAEGWLDDESLRLATDDRTQVQVKALPFWDTREMRWRWRIYLPPGGEWLLFVSLGEEWDESRGRYAWGPPGKPISATGELTLDACVIPDTTGYTRISVKMGKARFGMSVPEPALAVLRSQGTQTTHIVGEKQHETFAPTGHIELLRWHSDRGPSPPEGQSQPFPGRGAVKEYGFSIYLEEVSRSAAAIPAAAVPVK
jgi:hypothetical protein